MKDHNLIDKLFRKKLSGRNLEPADEQWEQISRLLDGRKKRRGGFLLWFSGFAILTTAVLVFNFTRYSTRSDLDTKNTKEPISSITPATDPAMTATTTKHAISDNHLSTGEGLNAKTLPEASPEVTDRIGSSVSGKEMPLPKRSVRADTPSTDYVHNSQNVDSFNSVDKVDQDNNVSLTDYSDFTGSPVSLAPSNADNISSPLKSDSDSISSPSLLKHRPGIFAMQAFTLLSSPQLQNTPASTRIHGLWSLQFTPVFGVVNSRFDGPTSLDQYLDSRRTEERATFLFGFEASVSRELGKFRISTGMQYLNDGEKINYRGERVQWVSVTDSITEYIFETVESYDTTFVGGEVIIDTVYTEVIIDSTQTANSYDEEQTRIDKKRSAHNGRTSIQHVIVPVRFGCRVSNDFLGGTLYGNLGMDIDYIVERRAIYISPNDTNLVDINRMSSYKKFNVSASAGIEYNYPFASAKGYFIVHPYIRRNLGSWNTEFTHRYWHYGVRFGVGFNL